MVMENIRSIDSAIDQEVPDQLDESIHLLSAGDCGSISRIPCARLGPLASGLPAARFPEFRDSGAESLFPVRPQAHGSPIRVTSGRQNNPLVSR